MKSVRKVFIAFMLLSCVVMAGCAGESRMQIVNLEHVSPYQEEVIIEDNERIKAEYKKAGDTLGIFNSAVIGGLLIAALFI